MKKGLNMLPLLLTIVLLSASVSCSLAEDWEQGGITFPLELSVGGTWRETIRIKDNWRFEGDYYYDGEDSEWGELSGEFVNADFIDNYTVSLEVAEVEPELFCMASGDDCILYLPGIEKDRLPETDGLDPYDEIIENMGSISNSCVLYDLSSGYILAGYYDETVPNTQYETEPEMTNETKTAVIARGIGVVSLRSEPSTASQAIARIMEGTMVEVYIGSAVTDGWKTFMKVKYRDKEGYVIAKYLKFDGED